VHIHRDVSNPAELLTPWVYVIVRYNLINRSDFSQGFQCSAAFAQKPSTQMNRLRFSLVEAATRLET